MSGILILKQLNQHGARSSGFCQRAFTGKRVLPARRCRRFPRSANQHHCRSCVAGADLAAAWLAPFGHRQSHQTDVPRQAAVSA
jgi:hypothetical protein